MDMLAGCDRISVIMIRVGREARKTGYLPVNPSYDCVLDLFRCTRPNGWITNHFQSIRDADKILILRKFNNIFIVTVGKANISWTSRLARWWRCVRERNNVEV